MSETILFSEWAGRLPASQPRHLEAPAPCIICGAPMNTCKHDPNHGGSETMTKATTKDSGAAETDGSVQAPSGQDESIKDETAPAADSDRTVVDQGEAIASDVYEELTGGERYVRLLKDVEETFVFPNSTRPSTKLLYTKGQIVRLSAIEGRTS